MTDQVLLARDPALDADWWRQATVYQIYPRSFADSNGDGIGDLPGVTSRMGYLADLGVDAIWLSPFYPSALADGGYDVDDYRDVAPELGTLDDFDALVAAAHAAGLRVIVDIVPNHTSDLHPWFVEALASAPGSAARDRYIFRDGTGPDGSAAALGLALALRRPGLDPACRTASGTATSSPASSPTSTGTTPRCARTSRPRCGSGPTGASTATGSTSPTPWPRTCPSRCAASRRSTTSLGTDGNDPLFDRDEVHEIYAEWREVFNAYDPPRTAVAEAFARPERRALYARPTGLGQAFNFDLLKADFDAVQFRDVITFCLTEAAKVGSSSTWVLSNHDVVRHTSRYALPTDVDLDEWLMSDGALPLPDEIAGLRRARAATLLMLALPGSSYLYQGEELGLHEVSDLPASALQDPIWHRTLTPRRAATAAGCRCPGPVRATRTASAAARPGCPSRPASRRTRSSAQTGQPESTLELYREALRVRRQLQSAEELDGCRPTTRRCCTSSGPGGWHSVTNFGTEPVALPEGVVRVSSAPLTDGRLPGECTVWLTEWPRTTGRPRRPDGCHCWPRPSP